MKKVISMEHAWACSLPVLFCVWFMVGLTVEMILLCTHHVIFFKS